MARARRFTVLLSLVLGSMLVFASLAMAAADDDFPGVPLPASPVHGSLDPDVEDLADIYSVNLAEGDELQLDLTGSADSWIEINLLRDTGLDVEWVAYTFRLNYPKDLSLAVPVDRAGTYYVVVEDSASMGGTYTLTWSKTNDKVQRLWGNGRYDTSAAISRSTFATSDNVVIATGTGYADALAASGLAGALDAPVLLMEPDGNSDATWTEIERLGATNAYIVGGTAAISDEVQAYMEDTEDNGGLGMTVTRFAGAGRVQTAGLVADKIVELTAGGTGKAFVVTGFNSADALAIAPIAFSQKMPVLLVSADQVPSDTAARIENHDFTDVYIAGGTSAVSDAVATQLDAANAGATNVTRWAGVNRYATSAAVADAAIDKGWASASWVGLANGLGFADALSGGAWAGHNGGVLLLTSPSALEGAVAPLVTPSVVKASLFGGTGVLSAGVQSSVSAAVAAP